MPDVPERKEESESYGAMLKQVPLWFWLALIAPIIVGLVMTFAGK